MWTRRGLLHFIVMLPLLSGCPSKTSTTAGGPASLPNGLRVTVQAVDGAPNAVVLVLFDIGSDQDPVGKSGLAHFVEHIYVTAAAGKTPMRSAEAMAAAYRAGWNAQTGTDYTVIATVAPAANVYKEVDEAAARMGALLPTQADIIRERGRLITEVSNMFAVIPPLAAYNNASERVRPSPGGGRGGGLPAHVNTFSVDDVTQRWRRYYKPKNAQLVVLGGGFEVEKMNAHIEEAFGSIPSGQPAPRSLSVPAPNPEIARVTTKVDGGTATVAYRAPQPGSRDYAAFLTLAIRLMRKSPQRLQYAPLDRPAVLAYTVDRIQGETTEQSVNRAHGTVRQTATEPLSKADKVSVTQFGHMLGIGGYPLPLLKMNPYSAAFSMARTHQMGIDPDALGKEIDALTNEDLQQVAAKVFKPENRGAAVIGR